ncbi:hypothetical protein DUZ99_10515 [Xylanibacillus composti]|uniref:Uncharacterized protein n=2 Tax=Xylanibacillus composti TaxID=1572762 RepID=A0A8J4H7Y4_9BACL|nr:hypothetical protein [Xylanibacillus composti]MDT9725403.1 hypothetical protein [Xylanibacillus composti]GIQ71446.1 hypothetical protein XYCOK13_42700 [Xylanibacillus composti]
MIDYLIFTISGTVEGLAMYIFVFALFCLPIRENMKLLVISSILINLCSYQLRVADLAMVDVLIHVVLYILFMWLMFEIPLIYSIILTIVMYVVLAVMQLGLIYPFHYLGFYRLDSLDETILWGRLIQLLSAGCLIGISFFLHMKRLHFSFVPNHRHKRVRLEYENLYLLILSITMLLLLAACIGFVALNNLYLYTTLLSIILVGLIGVFVYLAVKKDMQHYGKGRLSRRR